MRRALLLLNFGTPARASYLSVARYLNQMLTDPRVLTLPAPLRLLLGGLVIPLLRGARSAAAYRSIWGADGSPLKVQTEQLTAAVQQHLGEQIRVWYAMRLGQPSIERVLQQIRHFAPEHLTLLPLYPQYASSTTGTAMQRALTAISRWENIPELHLVREYTAVPGLAEALAAPLQEDAGLRTALTEADQVLFSFHGLPVSQIESSCQKGYCPDCPCTGSGDIADLHCYRAGCYRTARALARHLKLPEERWQVGFQSRLGNGWLEPFTDRLAVDLARSGARKLVVFCPSFTVDCLEVLEEIGIELEREFRAAGGQWLKLVPCPGARQKWVEWICSLVQRPGNPPPAT